MSWSGSNKIVWPHEDPGQHFDILNHVSYPDT